MLSPEFRDQLRARVRTLRIIWLAFISAPPFYVLLAYFITMNVTPERVPDTVAGYPVSTLMAVGLGVAFVLAAVSIYLRGPLLGDDKLVAGAGDPPGETDLSNVAEKDRPLMGAFYQFQSSSIIIAGIQETIALIGVLLVFLTNEFFRVLPFAALSVLLLAMSMPRRDAIEERLDSISQRVN